jgi:hypothetical protein
MFIKLIFINSSPRLNRTSLVLNGHGIHHVLNRNMANKVRNENVKSSMSGYRISTNESALRSVPDSFRNSIGISFRNSTDENVVMKKGYRYQLEPIKPKLPKKE